MKKIFLLSTILILLTGCTSIKNDNLDNIINKALTSDLIAKNTNRVGYRYYLPKGLKIIYSDNYNDIFTSDKYTYYLYVDIVSFNSKKEFTYNVNNESYYSKTLELNDKKGYIEINNYKNNQYLIEIMYNYAKIEVIVYKSDINSSVLYAMSVLSSITYNNNVIENFLKIDDMEEVEESFNIFEITGSDNYLEFATDEETNDERNDPDYIK